jgi:hypothetical protein
VPESGAAEASGVDSIRNSACAGAQTRRGARRTKGRGVRISTQCDSTEHKFAWREDVLGAAPSSRDVGKISLRPGRFVVCSRRC